MGLIARGIGAAKAKAKLILRRQAPKPVANPFVKLIPGQVRLFSGSMNFQGLARQARILSKNRGTTNLAAVPRWVSSLAENLKASPLSEDMKHEMGREVLLMLKTGAENSQRVLGSHLLDLSHRLNLHKEQIRSDPKQRILYEKYFLTNLPAEADWESLKRHFPYPEYASTPQAKLKAMHKEEMGAMHTEAVLAERRIGGEMRVIRKDYIGEFDDINSVVRTIGLLKQAYSALEKSAFS